MTFFTDTLSSATATQVSAKRPGFFARALAAMKLARQRQAEREIARYLALTGGKLTDETEREIQRRLLRG